MMHLLMVNSRFYYTLKYIIKPIIESEVTNEDRCPAMRFYQQKGKKSKLKT